MSATREPTDADAIAPARDDAEDRADARLARQGDGAAFARIMARHQAEISRRMWRFTRDRAAHEELTQDVFVNAYASLATYAEKAPFAHWLRRIAVRTGYAFWRENRRRGRERAAWPAAAAAMAAAKASNPDAAEAAEAGEIAHRLLAQLPPRDRLTLTLLYLEEQSVAEAAASTGWSRTLVKVRAWRARAKLKRLLEKSGF